MMLLLRDWQAVSPLGIGRDAFASAVRSAPEPAEPVAASGPPEHMRIHGFDKKTYLGKKGLRGMDTLGAYAVVASQLLADGDREGTSALRARTGVVLGTGTGSVPSHLEFILDIRRQENAEWINPIQFPQTVMNCAAGQVAIWHGFTGLNVTVSGGHHSGISALAYAANSLAHNRADRILVGCAEEFHPCLAQMFPSDSRDLRRSHRLGEGCFLALAERPRPGAKGIGVIAAKRLSHLPRLSPAACAETLVREIGSALADPAVAGRSPEILCHNAFSRRDREMAEEILLRLGAGPKARCVDSGAYVADCVSSASGFQMALMLALARGAGPCIALTFDPRGAAAFCVLTREDMP